MAENLKVTHYNNGNQITNIYDYDEWGCLVPCILLFNEAESKHGVENSHMINLNK